MVEWPEWWHWDLEFSQHLFKRMIDRQFNEIELRQMLEDATGYHADLEEGRWAIETRHSDQDWIVVVEPLPGETILLIVTAFPID
jgi:hypothetical protein